MGRLMTSDYNTIRMNIDFEKIAIYFVRFEVFHSFIYYVIVY